MTMHYIAFLLLSLLIVVVQTTVVPDMFVNLRFYDLLIPLAVYFSLYRPFYEGLPVLIAAAMLMDMISGAPAGIYMTTYIWLFLAFRQTWRFLDLKNIFLFPVIVIIGVVFQQLIFWIVISVQAGHLVFSAGGMQVVFFKILWAVVSAPIIALFLQWFFKATDRAVARRVSENGH